MQHPTEPLAARDVTTGWRGRRQRQDQAMVEPLVIPFVVVVRDELADDATPRALADRDQALEAGVLDGAHEALRVGGQVRRAGVASGGGGGGCDIGRGERVALGRPEERVAVMEEDPDVSQGSVLGRPGRKSERPPPGRPRRRRKSGCAAECSHHSAPMCRNERSTQGFLPSGTRNPPPPCSGTPARSLRSIRLPATLPMARLAEYMTDLALILGEKEHVHFIELRESSAAVAHAIDHEAIPKVRARVHAVKTGDAQPEAMNARTESSVGFGRTGWAVAAGAAHVRRWDGRPRGTFVPGLRGAVPGSRARRRAPAITYSTQKAT